MTKAPFVLDHTTKNCPLEGVTIPAGAQAAVRQQSTPASGRGDAVLERRLVRNSPSLSNAERLEYEPATQLPQSGLVQHQITPLGSRQPAVWVSHSTGWRLYRANISFEVVSWTKRSRSDGSASFLLFVRTVLPIETLKRRLDGLSRGWRAGSPK